MNANLPSNVPSEEDKLDDEQGDNSDDEYAGLDGTRLDECRSPTPDLQWKKVIEAYDQEKNNKLSLQEFTNAVEQFVCNITTSD